MQKKKQITKNDYITIKNAQWWLKRNNEIYSKYFDMGDILWQQLNDWKSQNSKDMIIDYRPGFPPTQ